MKRSRYGSDLPLFDRNRDGYITLNEMEYRYAQRRVDYEGGSSTASSRSDSGKSSDKDDKPESRWRARRDDDRKSYRVPAPIEGTKEGLPDWFPRDDIDGDGQVARAEFTVTWSDSVMSDFRQFDLNEDGMITPQECLKAGENGVVRGSSVDAASTDSSADSDSSPGDSASSSSGDSSGSAAASVRRSPAPATSVNIDSRYLKYCQLLVAKYDKNGDKVLVRDEWVSMSKDPTAADADGNGRITVEEFASWSMKRR
jgi:Ca2+-binding EF-hand superfamily protein